MQPGLARIVGLLAALGDPQRNLRCVQVVGTNGKGSAVWYLSQLLGARTGAFYSPHLVRIHERIQVGGQPISDEALDRALTVALGAAGGATWFETVTAAALWHFADHGVDTVVLEAGLGGRLDATSAAGARWGILTRVALDHQQILGPRLEDIAREKVAAFDEARLVISDEQEPAVLEIARERLGSRLLVAGEDFELQEPATVEVPGAFRRRALTLARAAAERIACGPPGDITRLDMPGRLQVLATDPLVVGDVAHNAAALAALIPAVAELTAARGLPGRPLHLVFGAMRDKDHRAMLDVVLPVAASVWLPRLPGERAATPEALAALVAGRVPTTICADPHAALAGARRQGGAVLVCGSTFVLGPLVNDG